MSKIKDYHHCPWCKTKHQTPFYAFAHWTDFFTVTCENEKCGKKYKFFQNITSKIITRKKKQK